MGKKGALLLCLLVLMVAMDGAMASHEWRPFNRSCFPPGFIFGAGSAAYQVPFLLLLIYTLYLRFRIG